MTNSAAYLEGMQAFAKINAEARNPYQPGTVRYDDWESGYFAAFCADNPPCNPNQTLPSNCVSANCTIKSTVINLNYKQVSDLN